MPESIFDPSIHQDLEHLQGFRFRHEALAERLESVKKAPPEAVRKYKEQVGAKQVDCALLSEYVGISESTLKKLKAGGIADPRGSSYWLLCKGLGIDPRDLMGIPKTDARVCNIEACDSKFAAVIAEKDRRITELDEQYRDADRRLVNLRTMMLDSGTKCGEAAAKADTLQKVIDEKERHIAWLDRHIKSRNKIIWTLVSVIAALLLADICFSSIGWLRFGLF